MQKQSETRQPTQFIIKNGQQKRNIKNINQMNANCPMMIKLIEIIKINWSVVGEMPASFWAQNMMA